MYQNIEKVFPLLSLFNSIVVDGTSILPIAHNFLESFQNFKEWLVCLFVKEIANEDFHVSNVSSIVIKPARNILLISIYDQIIGI